jgi:DNA primase
VPPTKATHFDVFVDRVVYALTSPVGEIIGFGGRVLQDAEGQPKYKNSPETLLYKKGENLFGLHAARHQIRRSGRALVVEGNFDVMTLHAVGLGYAVAPQGTAITTEQVKLLSRFAREVVLMLDADPAGRAATLKVIHLFVEAGLPCRIAALRAETRPDGTQKKIDPDELARKDLPRLQQIIDAAPDAVEHFFAEVAGAAGPNVPERVRAINDCVPLLRSVQDRLARDLYCEQLAQMLKVPTTRVVQALRDLQARPQPRSYAGPSGEQPPQEEEHEREPIVVEMRPRELDPFVGKLLTLLAQHPALLPKVSPGVLAHIEDADVRAFLDSGIRHRALDGRALEEAAPEVKQAIARALMGDEFSKEEADKALADLSRQLSIPKTQNGLLEARKEALLRDDRDLVRLLNARILASKRA